MACSEESENNVLVIPSVFPVLSDWFDDETQRKYADVDVVVAGVTIFQLHRVVLGKTSNALNSLFLTKASVFGNSDAEAHSVKWMFSDNTYDEVSVRVLEKWLRFCYGTEIRLEPDECCAALASLINLDLTCKEELLITIESFMIQVAEKDMNAGVSMLKDCLKFEECKNDVTGRIDLKLAEIVLSKSNLIEHPNEWKKCIFSLPAEFLDGREYGELHTELSEFSIRQQYVKHNGLSIEEQRDIMMKCVDEELNCAELEQLESMQILSEKDLIVLYRRILRKSEEESAACKKRRVVFENELSFARLESTKRQESDISTGQKNATGGGSAYDERRHLIVSIANDKPSPRCDVFFTHLIDKTVKCKKGLLPFDALFCCPVYDGTRYVYFTETSYGQAKGVQFGCIDLETMKYEERPSNSVGMFGCGFGGCFHHGSFYAILVGGEICAYDVEKRSWGRCGVKVPTASNSILARLLSDPQDDSQHLYVLTQSDGLHRIDLAQKTITCVSSPLFDYDGANEALLLRVDQFEFIITAVLKGLSWYKYSSKTNTWTPLVYWKSCVAPRNFHNHLFYDSSTRSFFYHVDGCEKWEVVPLVG